MRIAVSVNEDEIICPHLGKAKLFCIFQRDGDDMNFVEVRESEGNNQNHIIEDILDCQVVISGQIGEGMMRSLESRGIKGVIERETTDVLEALKKL